MLSLSACVNGGDQGALSSLEWSRLILRKEEAAKGNHILLGKTNKHEATRLLYNSYCSLSNILSFTCRRGCL